MIFVAIIAIAILAGAKAPRRAAPAPVDAGALFAAVAAEIDRGASVRHALALVAPSERVRRLALTGQPIGLVAEAVDRALPDRDPLVIGGISAVIHSGAPPAQLFRLLAERARRRAGRKARVRVLTAQARFSASIVALLPVLVGVMVVATRPGGLVAMGGLGRTAVFIGAAMQLIGVGAVISMVRQHS